MEGFETADWPYLPELSVFHVDGSEIPFFQQEIAVPLAVQFILGSLAIILMLIHGEVSVTFSVPKDALDRWCRLEACAYARLLENCLGRYPIVCRPINIASGEHGSRYDDYRADRDCRLSHLLLHNRHLE